MHFHQVLNDELGCASYLLADGGEAIVVDPRWDVDVYLELARAANARIVYAVDTHDHADHVSGRGRLARLTGCVALRPGPALPEATEVRVGRVRLTALTTPGHRPEHLAFVVVDETRGEHPWAVLTGDSLLVGDVARPDLAVDPQDGARALHTSIGRLLALGDYVELWPGHVGGSLCGGAGLSPKTSSTIGFERLAGGPAALADAAEFAAAVAATTPSQRPPHVAQVVARNRGALADEPPPLIALDPVALHEHLARCTTILDVRPAADYDAGHLRGALNVPPGPGRATRVGWAVAPDEPLVVVGTSVAEARAFAAGLHAIGLWTVAGLAAADPFVWAAGALPVETTESWDVGRLAEAVRTRAVELVDVRGDGEWAAGHVAGSAALPLDALGDGRGRFTRSPAGGTIAVACAAGGRAALGASLLRRAGHERVVRVAGGIGDLPRFGIELERG